jgi:dTDP-4-dehydrorhamnose reductase
MQVIEAGASGTWHIAHPQILSRYDLAVMVAEAAGLDLSRVQGVSYQSLNRVAARPLRGGLKTEKAMRGLMIGFRPLQDSIRLFLERA